MEPYRIAKDSPVTDAQVDKKHLRLGDDWTDLTASQVKRLEASDVKLEQKPAGNSGS